MIEFFPTNIKQTTQGWTPSNGHAHRQTLDISRFVPVKWGGRHLLVPEKQLAAFADYAAGLGRFNRGHEESTHIWVDFFHKLEDSAPAGEPGLPVMPPGYERFVKKPIEAEVTAVGKSVVRKDRTSKDYDDLFIPVKINAGRAHGVRAGMSLHTLGPGESETISIARAGRRFSHGVIYCQVKKGARSGPCVGYSDDQPAPSAVVAGTKLSTSPHRKLSLY